MYFYKNVHGGGYQPTTTPLEIDSKREYSIFVTPTEVLNNPDVEFIVARKLPSSRSIFSTAAHGGSHCANISSLLQHISHSRDPPFHPLPSSSISFSLSPSGSKRGERWGRRRSPASDAAAALGSSGAGGASDRRGKLVAGRT